MTDLAAIHATFADYKRLRSRKVGVLLFEVPLEQLHDAIAKLGGEPSVNQDTWCAIARMNAAPVAQPDRAPDSESGTVAGSSPAGGAKRSFDQLPCSQQAALACQREAFQRFLHENHDIELAEEAAAGFVREECGVSSRSDLDRNAGAATRWWALYSDFQHWLQEAA